MLQRFMIGLGAFAGALGVSGQASWSDVEGPLLTGHTRLTSPEVFAKAGEAYFSPDLKHVIFQAVPVPPEGEQPDPDYSMYVAELVWEDGTPVRLDGVRRISPEGSANTCGWFHPEEPGRLLYGTTLVEPAGDQTPGYQRGSGKYKWAFPREMTIVDLRLDSGDTGGEPIFVRDGYTAEGSWSPDGRSILYAQVDEERSRAIGRPDADIWVYDMETGEHTEMVIAEGYDGGPFFNADGSWICYRSDRRGDNQLQLFVSKVDRDASGRITGASRETQLTDNEHVNWAPYFHPSKPVIVYTSSESGHFNYELYAVPFDARKPGGGMMTTSRVTFAPGFDGLGVFSPDGRWIMWTSQRGLTPDEGFGTSQLWIARMIGSPIQPTGPLQPVPGQRRPQDLN